MTPEYSSFLRGPSVRPLWNAPFKGLDFAIGKYRASAGERPDTNSSRILLGVWCGGGPVESRDENGHYVPYSKKEGPLNLYPCGKVPGVRRVRDSDFILIEIEPNFIDYIKGEAQLRLKQELPLMLGFHDIVLRRLTLLLADDGNNGFSFGNLFTEHVMHALAIRLLSVGETKPPSSGIPASPGLPPHILKRVIACMRESPANLSLDILASEAGYSRYHFLRMFRSATGVTPHAYSLRLRLERGRILLREGVSAAEAADLCGFSSASHFSKVFRQAFGQSPKEFKRDR